MSHVSTALEERMVGMEDSGAINSEGVAQCEVFSR